MVVLYLAAYRYSVACNITNRLLILAEISQRTCPGFHLCCVALRAVAQVIIKIAWRPVLKRHSQRDIIRLMVT